METRDDGSGIRCNEHPDAPHGFMRDASHSAGRYVCECESWESPKNKPMTRDEWMAWLRESWDEAQARTHTIKTWRERCEEHPDHDGIVSEQMIRARMQEEIDELRQAIEQAETREWVGLTDDDYEELLRTRDWGVSLIEAVEAKLKEKNT